MKHYVKRDVRQFPDYWETQEGSTHSEMRTGLLHLQLQEQSGHKHLQEAPHYRTVYSTSGGTTSKEKDMVSEGKKTSYRGVTHYKRKEMRI
jgi:hypothetical protein